jgi:hypothetical protein
VQSHVFVVGVRRLAWAVAAFVVGLLVSGTALGADPKAERDAQALQKKAIEEDYLNVDYAAAVKNLQAAAAKCDADKCRPAIKGAIVRDLGAMQILGGSVDEGKLSFTQALGIDDSLDLDPSYKNAQLSALWGEAKKNISTGPSPAASPPPETPPAAAGAPAELVHTPPTEALVRTPLAVYVEYSGTDEIAHVVAKYKGTGMSDWKSVELRKLDHGYGALLPCADIALGSMQYYIQGVNSKNDVVAASGSRTAPIAVSVTAQISGGPAALPGQPAPVQCEETTSASPSECPPDFPGCKSSKKAAGAACAKDLECESGACDSGKCSDKKDPGESCQVDDECKSDSCTDGKCVAKKGEGEDCESSSDCESNRCRNGKCSAPPSRAGFHRVWLGLSVEADWYVMPAGDHVCAVPGVPNGPSYEEPVVAVSNTGYSCVDSSGNRFPSTDSMQGPLQDHSILSTHDKVTAGPAFGNVRILASLDYALTTSMMVGLRAGYVLLTDPLTGANGAPFAPIHLEGRFTYVFGRDPLMTPGVAPYVFVGAGAGEFDAYVPVKLDLSPDPTNSPKAPYDKAQTVTVNAWQTAGPFFFSVGGGARYTIGTGVALVGGLKVQGAFGGTSGSLWGFAPELGVQLGL